MPHLAEATQSRNVTSAQAVRLVIPARPEYIGLTRLALTGLSRVRELSDDLLADLKLAITEACSNSVRHAYPDGAGSVEIRYELHADRLVVEVRDDGVGGARAGAGSGLTGLVDRVGAVDGTLTVDSPPGKGTVVRAVMPLEG